MKDKTRLIIETIVLGLIVFLMIFFLNIITARAETITASWYSDASLKQEGTYKYSKGVMANGQKFNENNLTCATRLYPLGTMLRITAINSNKTVIVKVTDRIGKRFAKTRIDLSKRAFSQIADLKQGLVQVKVEVIK